MTRPISHRTCALFPILALSSLCLATPAFAAPPVDATDRVFVGYLFGPPRDINFKLFTHICHAFVTADGDGTLRKGRNVPNKDLVSEAHNAGVKVQISLGGWGWDKQFAEMVTKPEAEDRYVKAVVQMLDENDYDGLDLDWEYPDTTEEIKGFERLTRRFRKEIDTVGAKKNKAMFLTMAASSNLGTLKWLEKDFLLETMDWVNVMTYDYTGDWTDYAGHHSPLFASSKQPGPNKRSSALTIEYLLNERGIPANRLALGIPLYGRGFPVAEPYASTKGVEKKRVPGGGYKNIQKLIDQGWTRQWDDETKNPWLISPDKTQVIGYDDAESVKAKTEWANQKHLRGVFFWEIHGDRTPDGTNPLLEASRAALDQGATAK